MSIHVNEAGSTQTLTSENAQTWTCWIRHPGGYTREYFGDQNVAGGNVVFAEYDIGFVPDFCFLFGFYTMEYNSNTAWCRANSSYGNKDKIGKPPTADGPYIIIGEGRFQTNSSGAGVGYSSSTDLRIVIDGTIMTLSYALWTAPGASQRMPESNYNTIIRAYKI